MAKYTLKELSVSKLEYGSGAAACEYDGNVRYVRITDITDDGKLANDIVSPSYFEEKHILHDGDILFARTGATVGKTFLYRETYGKCVYAGFLIRMIPDSSKVLPDYIYYFTKSPRYHNFVAMSMKVVAQPNINAKQYGDLEIDIPSFSVQETVVRKLTVLDVLIALRKEQLAKLDELVKARFVEMFGDPVSNPMDWRLCRFDTLCENLDYRRKPITASERESGIYPYYGASGIVDHVAGYLFDEDILLISEDGANLLMRTTPIAFSVRGKVWVNNHAHVVRFEKMSMQKYVEVYFSMIDISDYITGSAQPKLNQAKLNSLMIPVPGDESLDAFLRFIQQLDKSKLTIQASLDKLEVMKKALMQEYFG